MTGANIGPGGLAIRPLTVETWDAFADLAERYNGVWGGCWCTTFHRSPDGDTSRPKNGNRLLKQRLVADGHAHAAVVLDDEVAVGWCQYGSPDELPNAFNRKGDRTSVGDPPDYLVTCFFIDRTYRHQGVALVALRGAVDLIAQTGGGVIEAYPRDTAGRQVTSASLYSGTRSLFEQAGFTYSPSKGTSHCVMPTVIAPVVTARQDGKPTEWGPNHPIQSDYQAPTGSYWKVRTEP